MLAEPAESSDPNARLKQRATVGMVFLGSRAILQNLVILVSNVYLARLLTPGDYGIFGILQFALSLFKLIGDTGLAAALVQKKEAPDDIELSTIFWFQLGLGACVCLASFAAVPLLPIFWKTLPPGAEWLLPGLSLSLLFTMARVVPFLVLERQVNFAWVGTLEFLGTVGFYGSAVFLALRGSGASALVWASVIQAGLVAIAANLVQRWRPLWVFSWKRIRGLLKFGFAFQGNNVVGFINSAVTPLLAGARLGKEAFGILQFAQNTAWFPSMPVGIVRRVYFPYLSRLQNDRPAFVAELETAVVLCALPCFFFMGLFLGGAPAIVSIIYGDKWLPAVPLIYAYSIGFSVTFYTWIASAAIEALGRAGRMFKIAVISTVTNWAATLIASLLGGSVLALGLAFQVHMIVTPIATFIAIRELVPEARTVSRTLRLLPAAGAVALIGRLCLPWIHGAGTLIGWLLLSAFVFSALVLLLDGGVRRLARAYVRKLL